MGEKEKQVSAAENVDDTGDDRGTLSIYTRGFKSILAAFTKELTSRGVDQETVKGALTSIYSETMMLVKEMHGKVIEEAEKYRRLREQEERRRNYLGRALLVHIEEFFPTTREAAEKVLSDQSDGLLPREIAQGVLAAVESAQGYDMLEEYEEKSRQIAEKYRQGDGNLIDLDAFVNDSEVRMMVRVMLGNLKKMLEKRGEKSKKDWLTGVIENSANFQKVDRYLAEEEYTQIVQSLFTNMAR